jgi:hypothetical protein
METITSKTIEADNPSQRQARGNIVSSDAIYGRSLCESSTWSKGTLQPSREREEAEDAVLKHKEFAYFCQSADTFAHGRRDNI